MNNDRVLASYLEAYRSLVVAEPADDSVVLSFPLHLSAGHRIEVTVTQIDRERYILSDSARTLGEVRAAGYSVTDSMLERVGRIALIDGVRIIDGYLLAECSGSSLGTDIQRFAETCKTIGDVYLVHRQKDQPNEGLLLAVRAILEEMGLHYRLREKIHGEIESHPFDLVVPGNGRPGIALGLLAGQNTHNIAQIWGFKCEDVKRGAWYKSNRSKLAIVYDVENYTWSENSRAILGNRADLAIPSTALDDLRNLN